MAHFGGQFLCLQLEIGKDLETSVGLVLSLTGRKLTFKVCGHHIVNSTNEFIVVYFFIALAKFSNTFLVLISTQSKCNWQIFMQGREVQVYQNTL